MIAATAVLVLLGIVILVLCVWLGDGRAKGVAILGFISGIFFSTTGFATGLRNWVVEVFTNLAS